MPTPVQLSTVGQPLIQGNHKLLVIEVPFRLRAAHSEAKHCIFYITYIHMCVFGGGDIHAIFQTFVYTLSFLVPQLSYRGSTFIKCRSERSEWRHFYLQKWCIHPYKNHSVAFILGDFCLTFWTLNTRLMFAFILGDPSLTFPTLYTRLILSLIHISEPTRPY